MKRSFKLAYDYSENPAQQEFHTDNLSKILMLLGGYGSGKSYALVMKNAALSYLNQHLRGGCVVPSFPEYKKDLLPAFEDILEQNGIQIVGPSQRGFKNAAMYHGTEKWWRFPWSRGKLYVVSAEKRIKGPNWAFATLNEFTLMEKQALLDTLGRVRLKGAPCPQIAGSGTPEGDDHWSFDALVEKPIPGSKIIYARTVYNMKNLAGDYIGILQGAYDKAMQAAYLEGQFVNMLGNRFYYCHSPAMCRDNTIEWKKDEEVHVSLDYNVSPMCATLWQLDVMLDGYGRPIIDRVTREPIRILKGFAQIEIEDNADAEKLADALYAFGLEPDLTLIYPDPAGNSRGTKGPPENQQLKARGWHRIRTRLAAPRFRARQLRANAMLERGMIKYHPDHCQGIDKDFRSVKRDPVTGEKDKDNPKLTHYSDGFDYMIDILFPLYGSKPEAGSIKYR